MVKNKENKEGPFDFYSQWYELWMQQSKVFFESADKYLKDLFATQKAVNPEDHMQQINQWVESLKNQWRWDEQGEQQQAYKNYWKTLSKMCMDATDLMLQQWASQYKKNQPIHNVRELYELWLNCCHEVYGKAIHSPNYQEAYGDMMNAAIHFWKSAIPK